MLNLFIFQKTEEAATKRKRLAELAECWQMAEEIQLQMADVKFFIERGRKEHEKLHGDEMTKLLEDLRKTLARAKHARESADSLKDTLDFKE